MIMMPYGWPWPIIAVHSLGRLLASHRAGHRPELRKPKLAPDASTGCEHGCEHDLVEAACSLPRGLVE